MIVDILLYIAGLNKGTGVMENVLWAISFLSEGSSGDVQYCIDKNLISISLSYIDNSCNKLSMPALRALGNVFSGLDQHALYILNQGFMHKFTNLCLSKNEEILFECLFILSNIVAGTE